MRTALGTAVLLAFSAHSGVAAEVCAPGRVSALPSGFGAFGAGAALPPGGLAIGRTAVLKPGAGQADARLVVETAGIYRFGLGARAWIDVLRDGRPVETSGHEHGGPCSPIVKIVAFRLAPGSYIVRISRSPTPEIRVFVAR